jgi:retron-type reverse transcriptase
MFARWRRCRTDGKIKRRAPGIDGVTFETIEEGGVEGFLRQIRDELITNTYRPMLSWKKEIPKDDSSLHRVTFASGLPSGRAVCEMCRKSARTDL